MAALRFVTNQIAIVSNPLRQFLSGERFKAIANAILDNAVKLIWIFASVLIMILVLPKDLVAIESVPKVFSEKGYTPEVVSRLKSVFFIDHFFIDHRDYVQASTALRKAIDLDGKNWAAHNNLGNPLRRKLDDAIAEYRRAIHINPKYALAHNN
jgi:tetratricopeptide (TPR) repeat protein